MYIGAIQSSQGDPNGDALVRDALANVSKDFSDRNYLETIMGNLLFEYNDLDRMDVGGRMFAEYGALNDPYVGYWAVASLVNQGKNELAHVVARSASSTGVRAAMLSELVLLDKTLTQPEKKEILDEILEIVSNLRASDESLRLLDAVSRAASNSGDVELARSVYQNIEMMLEAMRAAAITSNAYAPLALSQRSIAIAAFVSEDLELYDKEAAVLREMDSELADYMEGTSARMAWNEGDREGALAKIASIEDLNIRREMILGLVPEYSPF